MNKKLSKFLLAGDKFMSGMDWEPAFMYSFGGLCIKPKERTIKLKKTGDLRYVCQTVLDKVYFQHDMAYWDFKDLLKKAVSDKFLRDKAFYFAKNLKHDEYQWGLASMVQKNFGKKFSGGVVTSANKSAIKSENMLNQQLPEKYTSPLLGNLKNSSFTGNLRCAQFTNMPLISKYNKGNRFLFGVIDTYSKYA